MKKTFLLLPFALLLIAIVSCRKDKKTTDDSENPPTATTGTVKLRLDHNWEGTPFVASEMVTYVNSQTDDTLKFTMFRYYISNIKLKKEDGTFYVQPESYYLVNVPDVGSPVELSLANIPVGNYTDMYFTFGVDSTRNVSGAQTGALDPVHGMFWNWSTGYIMSKAEGLSPNSQFGNFAFHLGGFHGANSVVIEKQVSLGTAGNLNLSASGTKTVRMNIAVEKMWENRPSLSSVSDLQSPGAAAKAMATTFVAGMTLNTIE